MPAAFAARATTCGSRAAELARGQRTDRRGAARPSSSSTACCAPDPAPAHYDADAAGGRTTAARAGGLRPRAAAPAGASRPPPTARSAWSSRSSAPRAAARRRGRRHAPRRSAARSPRSRCGCTRPWSRPACATVGADPPRRPARGRVTDVSELDVRRVSGSRCRPTSRSCCCGRRRATATCRSGSAPSRPPRSPSPSRASCRRGR